MMSGLTFIKGPSRSGDSTEPEPSAPPLQGLCLSSFLPFLAGQPAAFVSFLDNRMDKLKITCAGASVRARACPLFCCVRLSIRGRPRWVPGTCIWKPCGLGVS